MRLLKPKLGCQCLTTRSQECNVPKCSHKEQESDVGKPVDTENKTAADVLDTASVTATDHLLIEHVQ